MAEFVRHEPCPSCGSKDNLAVYDDGSAWCFGGACDYQVRGKGKEELFSAFVPGDIKDLTQRKIGFNTCKFFDYRQGIFAGVPCQIANYKDKNGKTIRQKIRLANKKMTITGPKHEELGLYGKWLWKASPKLSIVITEGEIDALSYAEANDCKWPVVSVPLGAGNAEKALKADLEWLMGFKKVILAFDNDKAGNKATEVCSRLFPPGQVAIAKFKEKDLNEVLKAGHVKLLRLLPFNAETYRPDGIVSGNETWDILQNRPVIKSVPYPKTWEGVNYMTCGMRLGELDTWTAGTGTGKTQVMRELQHHILNSTKEKIGILALEETVADSVEALMSVSLNKRIHLSDVKKKISKEDLRKAWEDTSGTDRVFYFDHFGSLDNGSLVSKLRYMAKGLGCKYIFLDHFHMVISEFADSGGELGRIDTLMSVLKRLTQELNIWIGMVVHLRKSTQIGESFEEGTPPSLDDLRGSSSLKQLSNNVFALTRNQQAEVASERNISSLHVLKCRHTGRTGLAQKLLFDEETGRLKVV